MLVINFSVTNVLVLSIWDSKLFCIHIKNSSPLLLLPSLLLPITSSNARTSLILVHHFLCGASSVPSTGKGSGAHILTVLSVHFLPSSPKKSSPHCISCTPRKHQLLYVESLCPLTELWQLPRGTITQEGWTLANSLEFSRPESTERLE